MFTTGGQAELAIYDIIAMEFLFLNRQLLSRPIYLTIAAISAMACVAELAVSQTASYPDQHYLIRTADSLLLKAELISNVTATSDGQAVQLVEGSVTGYLILSPQTSAYPFNIGLPSWNGTAPGDSGGFRVLIRVPYLTGWSPWLDVGYWKANLWPSKTTRFGGGWINVDIVELYYYTDQWQFAVELKRSTAGVTSPTLSLLSFFVSDSRTTQNIDYNIILADKPEQIFIPTTFLPQYRLSNEIGGSICSPTTVSMILLSYNISVDPLQFAWDTYDPYWKMFGVWPRVVQNASEYGVVGTVSRYRSWSQAREVLAKGGRIGMSIGRPLYEGHLVMLAGFTANGDPIVHDPARTYDGYAHVFNKNDLSHSWFDKGGVAYTFFLKDTTTSEIIVEQRDQLALPASFNLYPNFPNPFNASTTFRYQLPQAGAVELAIYNLLGERLITLVNDFQSAGFHERQWDGRDDSGRWLPSGVYFVQLRFEASLRRSGRLLILR